jgi:A/G-specific adenine glycosylase
MLPLSPRDLRTLKRSLLYWYDMHRRDLPWRRDSIGGTQLPGVGNCGALRDPYPVWVSEIMLQQTRVAAVLDHYARWMQRFPTIHDLAKAREQSVLALWSGLGYYHRARRMHQAAKVIVREHQGDFPRTAEACRELPGIGRYTAAAIASIAFGEPVAVVDGNVERVVARVFGAAKGSEDAWQRAEALLDHTRPGDFNQAMMELGATICTPRAPQCLLCPLYKWCQSRGADAPKPQVRRKRRQLRYALAHKQDSVLLVQRPTDARRMAGMWELPETGPSNPAENILAKFRHSITDTDYEVSIVPAPPTFVRSLNSNARWFTRKQCQKLPLTGLTRKVLRKLAVESAGLPIESNSRGK